MNNSLPKLLITGASGQMGHALLHHEDHRFFNCIPCSHQDLDITNPSSIRYAFEKYSPDMVINTAAYTAVDKAESEQDAANATNHLGTLYLAQQCNEADLPLIHLSTDYVFNGSQTIPYKESDMTQPINVYGTSKLLGEEAIRKYHAKHIILRVSGIFSAYGANFYNTMQRLEHAKKTIRVVADQFTCPTYAGDIAHAILSIARQPQHYGTYHFCSTPATSWHHFAEMILQRELTAINTAEYPTAAKRPAYSVLDCQKIYDTYGIQQPSWKHAIGLLQ